MPVEAPMPAAGARGPILSAVLADANLQRFLHRDTHPDRFPLQVIDQANAGIVAADMQDLAGTAVLVPQGGAPDPQRAAFIIDAFEVGAGTARLAFRLTVEGLSGVATLVATGAGDWRVDEMRLTET